MKKLITKIKEWVKSHYDWFHMYFAILTINVSGGIGLWLFDGTQLPVLGGLFLGIIVAWMLQGVNESLQAIGPKLLSKYGSYKAFIKNSRRDWKLFIYGNFVGIVVWGAQIVLWSIKKH